MPGNPATPLSFSVPIDEPTRRQLSFAMKGLAGIMNRVAAGLPNLGCKGLLSIALNDWLKTCARSQAG
jgi:hypothetical protein